LGDRRDHPAQPARRAALPRADAERANLSLIAFSRLWGNGDGQILALVVMTVAACEVCIGLGMIVAIYRRNLRSTSTSCGSPG